MGLHQMQVALLVPDDSLLLLWHIKNLICLAKRDIFHLGLALPSNIWWSLILLWASWQSRPNGARPNGARSNDFRPNDLEPFLGTSETFNSNEKKFVCRHFFGPFCQESDEMFGANFGKMIENRRLFSSARVGTSRCFSSRARTSFWL